MLPFLTAFDSISTNSGSIDPLGALQTYVALADLLLPGVTTITNRSRYLSMLCAALKNIENPENHRRFPPGPIGVAERRKAVEPFERLWVVACVAAREQQHAGAADRLLGITYAVDALSAMPQRVATALSVSDKLLPPTLVGWPMNFSSGEGLPLVTPALWLRGQAARRLGDSTRRSRAVIPVTDSR